MMKNKQICR